MNNSRNRWKRAGIAVFYAACVWAILVAVALGVEKLFNAPGPEHAAPIPAIFLAALFLGWIPAAVVGAWRFRATKDR